MKEELDKLLCEKYPKMMVNRHKPMTETCMCWGFDCGDGWYNILNQLMGNIQHHIDWKNRQREVTIRFNKIREAGQSGNVELFADLMAEEYGNKGLSADFIKGRAEEFMKQPLQPVPEEIPQVTLDQVKEKFGTLRFYYTGGDDVIDGMVRMAEAMSGCTCEGCGAPAERDSDGGWVRTMCQPCLTKREEERKKYYDDLEFKKLLKEGNEQ
jgi:hypothetical protein